MSRSIIKIKRLIDKELLLQRKAIKGIDDKVMKKASEAIEVPKGESFWGKIGTVFKR